jgi:dTDP-4-amino-4,6-dideoxygalactose transaminase
MFIPTFQGLTATDFVLSASGRETKRRYPFDVPHLTFYRARNAIYHLFRVLKSTNAQLTVLVPDYNSGNEVLALEAAGATIRYYPVGPDGQADVAEVERLCAIYHPDVLYVIHYLGWPQPIRQFAELAGRRGMWLVEDCALALLSDAGEQPLGTFGHFSIFCLYKTLPLPNGACLVENGKHLAALDQISQRQAGLPSVLGRTAELVVRNIRSRSEGLGAAMDSMKRAAGRAVGAMDVPRAKIGDIGFNIEDVDLAMSEISARLLKRFNFEDVRTRRINNYRRLARQLAGQVTPLHDDLPVGACPLLFPILVEDKHEAAEALRGAGVEVLQFWNHGAEVVRVAGSEEQDPAYVQEQDPAYVQEQDPAYVQEQDPVRRAGLASQGEVRRAGLASQDPPSNAQYLRRHVLGLPIHQDLTDRHIDYVAEQVSRCHLRMS